MSFVSGTIAAINQGDAADAANQNQKDSTAQQQANFETVQAQEAPYRQLGTDNIGSLQKMISGGYDMKESPSAQYAMGQGTKAINSNLQARGLEGNAVQQLGQLSSSTAASDYQSRFANLLSATNIGSNAVAMTGSGVNSLNNNLQSAAGNTGNILMNSANAQSSIAGANAGAGGQVASKLIGNYMNSGTGSAAVAGPSAGEYDYAV